MEPGTVGLSTDAVLGTMNYSGELFWHTGTLRRWAGRRLRQGTVNKEAKGNILSHSASPSWTWRAERDHSYQAPIWGKLGTQMLLRSLCSEAESLCISRRPCTGSGCCQRKPGNKSHSPPSVPHISNTGGTANRGRVYLWPGWVQEAGYGSGTGSGGSGCPLAGTAGCPSCCCLTY